MVLPGYPGGRVGRRPGNKDREKPGWETSRAFLFFKTFKGYKAFVC